MNTKIDIAEVQWPDMPFGLLFHSILIGKRGSEAHGTYIPSTDPTSIDDRDLIAIVIPPTRFYCGLEKWDHAEAIKGPWDVVVEEFTRFVTLAKKQNPGLLQVLWLRKEDYLSVTVSGHWLLETRNAFRAKHAAFKAFSGYANSQLQKMTLKQYRGYMGDKRKKLVEQFGYDIKNAAHLIRLLETGRDFLLTGELSPYRHDEKERNRLLAIKRGEYKLNEILRISSDLFEQCKDAFDHSPLPDECDEGAINDLIKKTMMYWFDLRTW